MDINISQSWCQRFAKRHVFSHRKAREVERVRAVAAASPEVIVEYFEMLDDDLTSLDLKMKPAQRWNCDEKGWSKQQALQQCVLCTKGKPQV